MFNLKRRATPSTHALTARDLNPGALVPLEHDEQSAFFQWIADNAARHPAFESVFAIPNGGFRHKPTAMRLQREGVRAGVPDIFVAYPSRGKGGMFIEMKRAGGKASDVRTTQWEWLERLEQNNYAVAVCYGCDEAITAFCRYLKIKNVS